MLLGLLDTQGTTNENNLTVNLRTDDMVICKTAAHLMSILLIQVSMRVSPFNGLHRLTQSAHC